MGRKYQSDCGLIFDEDELVIDSETPQVIIGKCIRCYLVKGANINAKFIKFGKMTDLTESDKPDNRKYYCKYHTPGCVYLEYTKPTSG